MTHSQSLRQIKRLQSNARKLTGNEALTHSQSDNLLDLEEYKKIFSKPMLFASGTVVFCDSKNGSFRCHLYLKDGKLALISNYHQSKDEICRTPASYKRGVTFIEQCNAFKMIDGKLHRRSKQTSQWRAYTAKYVDFTPSKGFTEYMYKHHNVIIGGWHCVGQPCPCESFGEKRPNCNLNPIVKCYGPSKGVLDELNRAREESYSSFATLLSMYSRSGQCTTFNKSLKGDYNFEVINNNSSSVFRKWIARSHYENFNSFTLVDER